MGVKASSKKRMRSKRPRSGTRPVAPSVETLAQVSTRGQITLPAEVRRAAQVRPGDHLLVRAEDGRIVLEPAVIVPVERYTEDRIREFAREADMTPEELEVARKRWGLS